MYLNTNSAYLDGLMSIRWFRGTKTIDSVNCRVILTIINKYYIYVYIFTSMLDLYFEDNHYRGV
jgi:hypothetical protein